MFDTGAAGRQEPTGRARNIVPRTRSTDVANDRGDRDDEDLVRLYLTDIGRIRCSPRTTRSGWRSRSKPGPRPRSGSEPTASPPRPSGRRCGAPYDEAPTPGVASCSPTSVSSSPSPSATRPRPPAARPGPGGQPRSDPRGREVRLAQGLQVLDLRHLVDPPGHHPRHRQHGPHHPPPGPCRRPARPAPQGAHPVRERPRPPAHGRRARRRARPPGRQGHGDDALRDRAALAVGTAP